MTRDFSDVCPACGYQCMTIEQCHNAQNRKSDNIERPHRIPNIKGYCDHGFGSFSCSLCFPKGAYQPDRSKHNVWAADRCEDCIKEQPITVMGEPSNKSTSTSEDAKTIGVEGAPTPSPANHQPVKPMESCWGCDGLKTEIDEIIRVARDNPRGLIDFLKLNFPKEWGMSKEEHRALLDSPTIQQPVDCRGAFEAKSAPNYDIARREDDHYANRDTECAWKGWETCWRYRFPLREAVKDEAYYRRVYEDCGNGPYHPFRDHHTEFGWGIRHGSTGRIFGYIGAKGSCFGVAAALNQKWEAAKQFIESDGVKAIRASRSRLARSDPLMTTTVRAKRGQDKWGR